MIIHSWLSTELAFRLGWTLLNSLWEGAVIAGLAAGVLAAIPRRSAQQRYLTLVLALSATLAAFAATFVLSPELSVPLGNQTTAEHVAAAQNDEESSHFASSSLTSDALHQDHAPVSTIIKSWTEQKYPSVAIAWLAGVVLLAAWRVAGWFGVQRLRVIRTEAPDASILQTALRLAERLQLTKGFDVLVSHLIETPMVIGWLHPIILIPASVMTGLAPSQLEAILAHELAHIRRQDYAVNLLQIVAETVLFYHPAIWWMSSQIRLEREQACDDVAIELCANPHGYAGALVAIEELRMIGSPALAAKGTGGRQLLMRIERILGTATSRRHWGLSGIVASCIIAAASVMLIHGRVTRADSVGAGTQPFVLQNDAPRLSPFTAVRWIGDTPQVEIKGTWYELISINDIPAQRIMGYLVQSNDFAPKKHFAEDMVEVMRDMGSEPGYRVRLTLKTLDTNQLVSTPDAPMTEANRQSVLRADSAPQTPGINPFVLRNDAPKRSPFSNVLWKGTIAMGLYDGTWYDIISIDNISTAKILDYLEQSNDFAPQKHFAEDLVEVMRDMGHPLGSTVRLELETSDTKQTKIVPNAPMTEENLKAFVNQYLSDHLPEPEIYIGGKVARPGVYPFLKGKTTVLKAIDEAGVQDRNADYEIQVSDEATDKLERITAFNSLKELRKVPDAAIALQDGDSVIVKPVSR